MRLGPPDECATRLRDAHTPEIKEKGRLQRKKAIWAGTEKTQCTLAIHLLAPGGIALYDETMTTTLFKILAWSALLAVAAATLSSIEMRPRLAMPVDLERLAAFAIIGLLFALAYPRRIWIAVAIVAVGIFSLEWLQHVRPDRHGRAEDALVKAAGALAGLCAGWVIAQFKLWWRKAG